MYLCILDDQGRVVYDKNLPARADTFLAAVEPFRDGLVVAVKCLFCWYWLADLCAREKIAFVLGHALYMKAIHGGKSKNDQIDAGKIARLLRGGTLPQAYVYPAGGGGKNAGRGRQTMLGRRTRPARSAELSA